MAPICGTEVEMWRAVFKETRMSCRNRRKLLTTVQQDLVKYFTDKDVNAGEVNTSPPEAGG